jgi:hypothetical protein
MSTLLLESVVESKLIAAVVAALTSLMAAINTNRK